MFLKLYMLPQFFIIIFNLVYFDQHQRRFSDTIAFQMFSRKVC